MEGSKGSESAIDAEKKNCASLRSSNLHSSRVSKICKLVQSSVLNNYNNSPNAKFNFLLLAALKHRCNPIVDVELYIKELFEMFCILFCLVYAVKMSKKFVLRD